MSLLSSYNHSAKGHNTNTVYQHPAHQKTPTFEEFAQTYLAQVAAEKRSVRRDELTVRAALSMLAHRPLDQIQPGDIRDFVHQRLEGGCRANLRISRGTAVSKATVNRDLAVIKHIFQRAVDDGLISQNPARSVKLFRVQEKARRVLSEAEERRLLQAAAPHLRPLLIVALNTGLRRSELMGLRWADVDLAAGYILVHGQTKSYKNRTVPLNSAARHALLSLPLPHDGLVVRFHGNRLEDVKKALAGAVRRAGIGHTTLHACRHTFATRLVMAGVPLPSVQRLLGHADIKTTMRYAHPAPEDLVKAVNALGTRQPESREGGLPFDPFAG